MNKSLVYTNLIYIAAGTLSSIVIGLVVFGAEIFKYRSPFFQIPLYGLTGSLGFILFKQRRYRDAIFVFLIILILDLTIFGFKFTVTRSLYFLNIIAGTYIYVRYFYSQSVNIKYARPILLAGIYAILTIPVALMLFLIYETGNAGVFPFRNIPIAFMIGLGMGIGFEISEAALVKRIQPD